MNNSSRHPRLLVLLLLSVLLFSSPWALGQPATDEPVGAAKSAPASSAAASAAQIWLTFGLDRASGLQYRPVADIPGHLLVEDHGV